MPPAPGGPVIIPIAPTALKLGSPTLVPVLPSSTFVAPSSSRTHLPRPRAERRRSRQARRPYRRQRTCAAESYPTGVPVPNIGQPIFDTLGNADHSQRARTSSATTPQPLKRTPQRDVSRQGMQIRPPAGQDDGHTKMRTPAFDVREILRYTRLARLLDGLAKRPST